ncbi:hypothetical protein [Vibrio furnissii]|uniref:hypothetical protein n=1 Tax=Vibrio furnissii TaxID=29494 RepID=UPI003AA8E5F1
MTSRATMPATVIVQVADLLTSQLRTTDFISRIGGEEFARSCRIQRLMARAVVERLRHAVDLDQSLTVPSVPELPT